MDFHVLGQLELWRDGLSVPLGTRKQRSLLALLLIHANETVSADRLIDELWEDDRATDRHNALWVQVSKLRSLLEPDRERRAEGGVLLTRVPGYVLEVQDTDVDAWRFEQLVIEARALIETDPTAASMVLGDGLAMWRGRPYEDFLYESFAQTEIARLDELRLEAVELRLDADLRRGLAAELVGELQGLVREHPLREQITAQLMLALYRSGRQAEALRAYSALRVRLGEELGLDPSSALQQLEGQILCADPVLELSPATAPGSGRLAIRGYELRAQIGVTPVAATYRAYQPAVGREVALTVIGSELADDAAFIRRFQADAETVARLNDPDGVPVYDFWREPGGAYLVTPLRHGVAVIEQLPSALAAVVACPASSGGRTPVDDVESFPASSSGSSVADAGTAPVSAGPRRNPYKGLQAFGEVDATDFFGRERVVERLLARLGSTGSVGRFVAVVGPSGSGKSSVVGAGLLPALRAGALPGSAEWFIAQMTPSRHPYDEAAAALRAIAVDPPPDLLAVLTEGLSGIGRGVRRVLPDDRSQVLLVIDQFEEAFTLADPQVCRAFLDALAEAVDDRHSRVRVVITLRADFYDRPLRHRDLGELLRRGTEPITVMSPEELQRAIEGPAERVGVHFEPGLVAEMVADVADHAAALPLLQYALTELFERRRGSTIPLATYHELGGVAGALVHRAEDVYRQLDPASREVTRQVMLRLVNVGDGDADEATRRRVLRQEVLGLGDERVTEVLDTLGRHRLLAFDRDAATRSPTVEIAHEALFVEWDRLRAWIADCRLDVRRHRRLANAAEEWRASAQAADYLLRGARLDETLSFAQTSEITLTPAERAFLDASLAQRDVERELERAQREREKRLHKSGRRRTVALSTSAVILAVITALALLAIQRRSASDRTDAARQEARRLASASTVVGQDDPELGMLLALQSLATSAGVDAPADVEAEEALHWAIQAAGLTYPVADAAVDVRQGPAGAAGIFLLPLADLVDLARRNVSRGFTPDECAEYELDPCPSAAGGLASPAATGPATVPASGPASGVAEGRQPVAGTKITILDSVWGQTGLDDEIAAFEEQTGIVVEIARPGGPLSIDALRDGSRPDVTFWPMPGGLNDLGRDGRVVDLGAYLDVAALRAYLGDQLVDAASTEAGLSWVPLYFDLKGVVWYPPRAFRDAGYQVPQTWAELLALSHRMVADGRTPWCLGFDSGSGSGHVQTDWLEALLLRVGGVELYDRWARHEVPFDHPAVRQAGELFEQIVATEGFTTGGPQAAGGRIADEAMFPMVAEPPGCWMNMSWSRSSDHMPSEAGRGENVDYFMLPPLERGAESPVLVGGFAAAALTDRPEIRALFRYIVNPREEWGIAGARARQGNFIPPRTDLGTTVCLNPDSTERENVVRIRLCGEVRDAVVAGNWRFDATDLMPGHIGSVDADGNRGVIFRAMTDYIAHGAQGIGDALAYIEAVWADESRP